MNEETTQPNPRAARLGLLLVLFGALLFFSGWWNQYASPTSNGEVVLLQSWAGDYLPYRDFFFQAPPGMPMLIKAIGAAFGPHVIAILAVGAAIRTAGACALYLLLTRLARPSFSAVATLAGLFVSSVDISDTTFSYNHVGTALVLVGTCFGAFGAEGVRASHRVATVSTGALFTLAIAVKQTMIFGAFAAFVALCILSLPRPRAGWLGWIATLVAGAAATLGLLFHYLASNGLVAAFLATMRRAPQGKGGIGRSLFRPLTQLAEVRQARDATLAALVGIGAIAALWLLRERRARASFPVGWVVGPVGVLLLVRLGLAAGRWDVRTATLFLTALGWWGSLAVALLLAPGLLRGDRDRTRRAHVALGLLGFGIGYCFSVSWPLFEAMAFPGLAVVVAVMLERPPSGARERWVGATLALVGASAFVAGYRKVTDPYGWGGWLEPPLDAKAGKFEHPALVGMRVSEPAAALYGATEQVARQMSKPDDRIFVFPNMAILYAIANRRPATLSLAHWVDICPDFVGREDAARLVAAPPKILILRKDPPALVEGEERLFRGGQHSSVRDVLEAIETIRPQYASVGVFKSPASAPIEFLVRRDAPR